VRTVRVLERTFTDSSWSLAYIFGVHGSTSFGNLEEKFVKYSVADPESGAFLTPGSGIRDEQPGSNFYFHIFWGENN
jgi:hypothetical protein